MRLPGITPHHLFHHCGIVEQHRGANLFKLFGLQPGKDARKRSI